MRRMPWLAAQCRLGLAGLAIACAAPVKAEQEQTQPYQLVRTLRLLQDEIAQGNEAAHAAQRQLIAEIAGRMSEMPLDVWREARNVRAVVAYVLVGGNPRPLRELLALSERAAIDENLMKGALAYAENRNGEARRLLGPLDPRTMDVGLGGQVALVQANLMTSREADKALAKLDDARLLLPGTLVEEAALRRQVPLLTVMNQHEKADLLASQYLRRFGRSVYASRFHRELASGIGRHPARQDAGRLARVQALFDMVGPEERRKLYLILAETSITSGSIEMAKFAAARAGELATTGSIEGVRSQVYEAAALVVSDKFEDGVDTLQSVDRSRLPKRDSELVEAALAVAGEVRRGPGTGDVTGDAAPASASAATGAAEIDVDKSDVVARAREMMAAVDQVLGISGEAE